MPANVTTAAPRRPRMEGESVVEINYHEVYNLVGRLLTLNDASNTDPVRREAQKRLIKDAVYGWLDGVARDQGMPEWGGYASGPVVTDEQVAHDQAVKAAA